MLTLGLNFAYQYMLGYLPFGLLVGHFGVLGSNCSPCVLNAQQRRTQSIQNHARHRFKASARHHLKLLCCEQTPCPCTGSISCATNLAANFGCNRFGITPDIVSKLLRAAI